MGMMRKPVGRLLFKILFPVILAGGIFFGGMIFAGELRQLKPVNGFSVFLNNKDICALVVTPDFVWGGGADGLYQIKKSAAASVQEIGDYKYVKALLYTGNVLWIGHDDGLTRLEGTVAETFTTADGLPDNRVNALCLDSDGQLWVGTRGGAAVFRDRQWVRNLTAKDGLIDNMVNVIMQDSRGGMWFGSYVAPRGGVTVMYKGKTQHFSTSDVLVHANVNAIIELQDQDVLVGGGMYTKGGGTRFSFKDGSWAKESILVKEDGLAGAKIRSLLEDSRKRLWAGSEYEGLAVIENGKSTILTDENGLSNNEVKVIKEDTDQTIWIGTREGIVRIDKGGIENVQQ